MFRHQDAVLGLFRIRVAGTGLRTNHVAASVFCLEVNVQCLF